MGGISLKTQFFSIMSIMVLILTGLSSLIAFPSIIPAVDGLSVWETTTYEDFNNGSFNDVTISGSGPNSSLILSYANDGAWVFKPQSVKPGAVEAPASAPIYGTDKILLHGGWNGSNNNGTWIYDLSDDLWTNVTNSSRPGPEGRHGARMTSIHGTDKALLFAGRKDLDAWFNDTWIYDLSENNWTQLQPPTRPISRFTQGMVNIWGTDKIVMFGGWDMVNTNINDTWIYDVSDNTWTDQKISYAPAKRRGSGMASIWGTDKAVLFGGFSESNGLFDDTWIYDLSDNNWTKKNILTRPGGRYYPGMSSVYNTSKVILFGGRIDAGNRYNDTWIFELSTCKWTKKILSNRPAEMYGPVMENFHETGTILLFGGYDDSVYYNGTWLFNFYRTDNGSFSSDTLDTSFESAFKTISWNGTIPNGTGIRIQLRTGADQSSLKSNDFIGPDGTNSSYYNQTPSSIWSGHYGDRWIQYKAYLNTSDVNVTPVLHNITIIYNNLPIPTLLSPANMSMSSITQPLFKWNFFDNDSSQQAFEVYIDEYPNFQNNDFYSSQQNSTNQSWQFPNGTSYSNIPDGLWFWKVRTLDSDSDWNKFSEVRYFYVDTKLPSSNISYPINNTVYTDLNIINGTASDNFNGTGLQRVEISIKRLSDNNYWNGTSWTTTENWLTVDNTTNWEYNDTNLVSWTSNNQYRLQTRAVDKANNSEIPNSSIVFYIDFSPPNSIITIPINNSYVNKLDTISGTASDTGVAGVNLVEITIKRASDNMYWSGSDWTVTETWLSTTGTISWSYDSGLISWSSGLQYNIRSRATDNIFNVELSSSGISFNIDTGNPVSNISTPSNDTFLNKLEIINGTAVDFGGAGLNFMELSIIRMGDGKSWDGSDWVSGISWLVASGTASWSYDITSVIWHSGNQYRIRSRASDTANNIEIPKFGTVIKIDMEKPSTTITAPQNNSYINSLVEITGSSADMGGSEIKIIQISIIRVSDNYYWSQSSWTPVVIWLDAVGTSSWNYNVSQVAWTTDTEYIIRTRATDLANNIEIPLFGSLIHFDLDNPFTIISSPDDGSFVNSVEAVSGSAGDTGGSGIKNVQISIKRDSDDNYWASSSWSAVETWLGVTGTTEWIFQSNDVTWTSGVNYTILTRAIDNASNVEHPATAIFFSYDPDIPNSLIDIPVDGSYVNYIRSFTGTAVDTGGSNLKSVRIEIVRSTDNNYWSGTDWVQNPKRLNVSGTNTWTFDASNIAWTTDTRYSVDSIADDNAGNVEIPGEGNTFMYDDKAPENLSIIINNGDKYTTATSVSLSLSSHDSGSGLDKMSFSLDGITWLDWEDYSPTRSYEIEHNDGIHSVHFRVIDIAGNIAESVFDSIVLDTEPPHSLLMKINDGAVETNETGVQLSLEALDNTSGVDQMSFSANGDTWTSMENYSESSSFNLTDGDGIKYIYFRVTDNAGLTSEPLITSIILNITVPIIPPDDNTTDPDDDNSKSGSKSPSGESNNLWWLLIVIIIVITIILLLLFVRRRKEPEPGDTALQPFQAEKSDLTVKTLIEPQVSLKQSIPTYDYQIKPKEPVVSVLQPVQTGHSAAYSQPYNMPQPQLPPPSMPPPQPSPADYAAVHDSAEPKIENIFNLSDETPGETAEEQTKMNQTVLNQLEKLGELKEKGILTDEEFQQKKDELLKA